MVLQIEFFFHCKNLPGWSGRIQLTSAVLPLIMNEDVENVEEQVDWQSRQVGRNNLAPGLFLWLEFSFCNKHQGASSSHFTMGESSLQKWRNYSMNHHHHLCTLFLSNQPKIVFLFHYFFKRMITQGHKCLLTLSTSFGKHFAHNAFGAGYFQAEQKFPKCSACWWYGGGAYYFKLGFRQEKIKLLLQSICCALPDLINRKEIVDMLVLFVCTKNISR